MMWSKTINDLNRCVSTDIKLWQGLKSRLGEYEDHLEDYKLHEVICWFWVSFGHQKYALYLNNIVWIVGENYKRGKYIYN